jgi:opacity protein-like surface antigen
LKLWIVLALCAAAYSGSAASFSPEVFASIAWAHVFRFDDQTFGDRPNAGAGFGLHHRSGLGAELEINRTFGLMARTAPCAISGVSCVGTGRDGVLSSTILTGNAVYRFGSHRVQPYVTGGLGGLWSRTVASVTLVQGTQAAVTEREDRDGALALSFGAGFRMPITRAVALRSEVRFYDGSARSRANLSIIRTSIGLGYRW